MKRFKVKSFYELWCLTLIAISGVVLGGIIGVGSYIVLSIPLITSATDTTGTMISHMIYGVGLSIVWGIGLGGTLGESKALVSLGDNWTDYLSTKNYELKYGLIIVKKKGDQG